MNSGSTASIRERFFDGDRGALARVLSYIEDSTDLRDTWIAELPPISRMKVVGVTGPPGAGKSTLVNALVGAYRQQGKTIGILAFDPSSRRTGGAALGDRVRMNARWSDEGVYIRSLANRGRLGGLSDAVFGALRAYDAFGFDVALIETVGVGQGEIDVASVADVTVLVQVPGTGDTVQLIKAGVLEIATILVVNKADLPGADVLLRDLRSLVTHVSPTLAETPVIAATATAEGGVSMLFDAIERQLVTDIPTRSERAGAEIQHYVMSEIERQLAKFLSTEEGIEIVEDISSGATNVWDARSKIMQNLRAG